MNSLRPAPTGSASPPRILRGPLQSIARLLRSWWSHKASFAISLSLTVSALLVYVFTFIHENPPTILEFVQRLELSSLDTRFRYRGRSHTQVDDRIVIVDIDQRSQEVLGRWPFSRTHFAHMLDALRVDGAKVVAFDITFSKPENTAAPIREMHDEVSGLQRHGAKRDPRFATKLAQLEAKDNADGSVSNTLEEF